MAKHEYTYPQKDLYITPYDTYCMRSCSGNGVYATTTLSLAPLNTSFSPLNQPPSPLIVMESLVVPASDITSHLYSPASLAVTLSTEMTDPTLGSVGVVHVKLRVGPPTASQVKLRGVPWETPVEGLAVRFTITGATTVGRQKQREVKRE